MHSRRSLFSSDLESTHVRGKRGGGRVTAAKVRDGRVEHFLSHSIVEERVLHIRHDSSSH
jgi:hypothetical protein